jgi:hypothetical protein
MARSALDALLGRFFDDGEELELLGGNNFIGFTITPDLANNRYDISVEGAFVASSRQVIAGAGLTGGGDLSADRTLNVAAADATITVTADAIAVGTLVSANFANNTIALARLVNATAQNRILCRASSGAGAWEESASIPAFTITALTCTTINGAAPLAPVEGTALADANANIVATDGSQIRIPTLTANRTYDINNTSAVDEESITLYRTGTEAFTATIRDAADATIATFPASTKLAGVFRKAPGANFVFVGFYRIA